MRHLTDEEIREKNARLAPHRAKAIAAFGEEAFWALWALADRVWLQGLNSRAAAVTGDHERAAVRVATSVEKARDDARRMSGEPRPPLCAAGSEAAFTWIRVHDLLAEAVRILDKHAKATSELRRVYRAAPSGPGRSSHRSRFVRSALIEHPESRTSSPGAWAHLGLAIHLDDEGVDFEELRKAYADLLTPGRPPRRKVRAREKRRNR